MSETKRLHAIAKLANCGGSRLPREINKAGDSGGENMTAKLMQQEDVRAQVAPKFKYGTTNSKRAQKANPI